MSSERAEVDGRYPFRSVKETVAVFSERLLIGKLNPEPLRPPPPPNQTSSSSSSPPSYSSSASHFPEERNDELAILASLQKLEAVLKETKRELLLMKQWESETEAAIARLNALLMKQWESETEAAIARLNAQLGKGGLPGDEGEEQIGGVRSERWHEERADEYDGVGSEYLPTLAQAFGIGDFGAGWSDAKAAKRKPIVPLITGIFSKKKYSRSFTRPLI